MAGNHYLTLVLQGIRDLFARNPRPEQSELDAVIAHARAVAGGTASGIARQAQPGDEPPADPNAPPVAASGAPAGLIRLGDDGAVQLATADINSLPDADFAYIEPGGTKDSEGKTTPRSLRHFPIMDAAHVRNALARASQSPFGDKALPAIHAAAKKLGIGAVAAEDDLAPVYTALRLDEGAGLPDWQVYHQIGNHGTHPRYGPIVFTQADGDAIIRNFRAGTLGRQVPLDFRHGTSLDGEAGGWVEEFRWGKRGEGLPGLPEPSGDGPILYARLSYTDIGRLKLQNEHYRHQSPEYDRNFQGTHGATALALASTNNPFLKGLRTLQGREPLPVMLDDATEDPTMADDATQLHLPPNMAAGAAPAGAPGTPGVNPFAAHPPAGAATPPHPPAAQGPGFAAGAKCPTCGTTMAGGEQYCSNCGMKAPAGPGRPPALEEAPMNQHSAPSTPPGGGVQLDAVALQTQLVESERRQAALEAQMREIQGRAVAGEIAARTDAAIYAGTPPALAKEIGGLLLDLSAIRLAAAGDTATVIRLSDTPEGQTVSLAAAIDVLGGRVAKLFDTLPRMPYLGRRSVPALEAPPPAGDQTAEQDKAYAEAIKAHAAELNAQRGHRNGASA